MPDEKGYSYADYMRLLRDCIDNLSAYQQRTGCYSGALKRLKDDLKHEDPFISYRASRAAIKLMRNPKLYH
ncbi:MAG: hypothetical protein CMF48_04275 [Legionellales bacterium]|nr:hypothetical protein [Legionellales bacterium]|tara:strand:+ start:600 stop:812 length:213 start_codon:yes stop_codon:yes gene_type:complete